MDCLIYLLKPLRNGRVSPGSTQVRAGRISRFIEGSSRRMKKYSMISAPPLNTFSISMEKSLLNVSKLTPHCSESSTFSLKRHSIDTLKFLEGSVKNYHQEVELRRETVWWWPIEKIKTQTTINWKWVKRFPLWKKELPLRAKKILVTSSREHLWRFQTTTIVSERSLVRQRNQNQRLTTVVRQPQLNLTGDPQCYIRARQIPVRKVE